MIDNNKLHLLEQILNPKLKLKKGEVFASARSQLLVEDRVKQPDYLINKITQGTVSKYAYGTQIRQVGMTRGNR